MAVKNIVDDAIAKHKIVIFSKSYCPYSAKAKETIARFQDSVTTAIFELDFRPDGDEIQAYLKEKTKQVTVPNIFINQKNIGASHLWLTEFMTPSEFEWTNLDGFMGSSDLGRLAEAGVLEKEILPSR